MYDNDGLDRLLDRSQLEAEGAEGTAAAQPVVLPQALTLGVLQCSKDY